MYIPYRPALILRDPEIIKNILVKDFNIFYDRQVRSNDKTDPLSTNLFLLKGAPWKILRYKLTPVFTTFRIKKMFPLIQKCASQFVDFLQNTVNHNKPTEMKETAAKYATDVISTCAFGIESNSLSDPNAEFREFGRQIFDFTVYRSFEFMSMFMLPLAVKYLNMNFFSKNTTQFLRKAFWDTMTVREEKKIKRDDFMDMLLQLKNTDKIEFDKNDEEAVDCNENDISKLNEVFGE